MNRREYSNWYYKYQSYLTNPDAFSYEETQNLIAKGQTFGVQVPDLSPGATIGSAMRNFGSGLVQGFSTIPVGDKPTNDVDGIAHSLGHLLGFIGVIPGMGTLASAGLKTVGFGAKAVRATKFATKIGPGTKAAAGAAKFRSVPMYAADKFVNKFGKTSGADAVRNFFAKDWQRQAIRHGVHLGAASVVSETWENLKEEDVLGFLTNSFMTGLQGGIFGAGFGLIGSHVKLPSSQTGMLQGDKILRGVAGGLFQTLPGAIQGTTTPQNVYNALLGAYFGGKAQPARYEKAHRTLATKGIVERVAYRNTKEFQELSPKDKEATLDLLDNFYVIDQSQKGLFGLTDWLGNLFGKKPPSEGIEPSKDYKKLTNMRNALGAKEKETLKENGGFLSMTFESGGKNKKIEDLTSSELNTIEAHLRQKLEGYQKAADDIQSGKSDKSQMADLDVGMQHDILAIKVERQRRIEKVTSSQSKATKNEAIWNGERVEIVNQTGEMKDAFSAAGKVEIIRADGITRELVRNEDLKILSEVQTKQERESKIKEEIGTETEPNDLGEQVIQEIQRPVEKFIRKLTKTENKDLTHEQYITVLNDLSKYMHKEIAKAKLELEESGDLVSNKTRSMAKAKELSRINKALEKLIEEGKAQYDKFEFKRAKKGEDKYRIGNIRTRDPSNLKLDTNKDKKIGSRIVNLIKEEFAAKGRDHIDVSPKSGSEGFWKKMGFKLLKENGKAVKGKDGRPMWRYDNSKEVAKFEDSLPKDAGAPWKAIEEGLINDFKHLKVTREDIRELKQFYIQSINDQPVLRYGWNAVTGQLDKQEKFDFNNNRISDSQVPTLIDRLGKALGLGDNSVMYIKNIWHSPLVKRKAKSGEFKEEKGDPRQSSTGNFDWTAPENAGQYKKMIDAADKKGFYPYSGKSDSEVIIFLRKNTGKDIKAEFIRIKEETTEAFNQNRKLGQKFNFDAEYKKIKEQAVKNLGITEKQFDEMFISNIRWWELQNQLPIGKMAFKDGFISDITNFNKRQQPLFTDYYPLTRETFPNDFRFVVVNDYANSKDPQIQRLYKKLEERLELSDGAVLVRTDVNQAILADHGLPADGGFSKSFFVSSRNEGLLIGKHAMHDAGAEISKAMKELGIDFIVPTSVAKQRGLRKVYDWNFNKQKETIGFSLNGKSLKSDKVDIYTMGPEDVLNSFGVYDGVGAKLADPVRVFKAIWDVMVDSDIMALKNVTIDGRKNQYREGVFKEIKDWISERAVGEARYNDMLSDYLAKGKRNDKVLNQLINNLERLGVVNVNDAFKENTTAAKAFREAARKEIMDMSEIGMEKGEITWSEENKPIRDDISASMIAKKASRGSDGNVLSKRLAEEHTIQIARYFLKKVVRPKVHSSGKAIMRSFDLGLVQDKAMQKLVDNPEIFFLDNGFKKKQIFGITKSSTTKPLWQTLEKRWEELQTVSPKSGLYDQLMEVLSAAVVRTPMDNVSAIGALKFAGFTGRNGGGILLHPDVMQRLGGADLDIDSANFYFGNALPKVVKDLGSLYKKDLVNIYKYADKKLGGMKKVEEEFLIPEKIEGADSYLNMFDPYSRLLRANSIQQAALRMRGVAVNSRFTMKWLYQQAKENNGTFVYKIEQEGPTKGWTFHIKARESEMDLKAKSVAAINMAVDIAKYNGRMVSPEKLNSILLKAGFESIKIISPKGKKYTVNPRHYELLWGQIGERYKISKTEGKKAEKGVELSFRDTPAGALANTMRHFFSRDHHNNRPFTHSQIQEAARLHPSMDNSHLATIADIFKRLDYQDSMLTRVITNINGFEKFTRQINDLIREDPTFTQYIQSGFSRKGVNVKKNIERIKIFSENYFPFSEMVGYESWNNLAVSRGIENLSRDPVDFLKFFKKLDDKGLVPRKYRKYYSKTKQKWQKKLYRKPWQRKQFIESQIKMINDFISNDMYDFASIKTTYDFGKIHNIPTKENKIIDEIYKIAANVKNEFRTVRKSVEDDPALSSTGTALDRISSIIKNEVEPSLYKFVDAYNAAKRKSAPPLSYQGIKEYFDSVLYGSIQGKQTQDYHFVELLVSQKIVQHHADIRGRMFDNAMDPPSVDVTRAWLRDYPGNQIGKDAIDFEANVLKGMRYDGKEKLDNIQITNKEVKKLIQDIKDTILSNKDGYFRDWKAEDIEQFFQGMLRKRGIGNIADADIYALRGIRNEIVDWRKGRGFFRWFSKGGGRKLIKSINEVGEKDKLRVGGGHWLKPAEVTAGDMYYNDIVSIADRFPVTTQTKEGKLAKLYAEAKVPMSHFEIMIKDVANMLDHPNQIRNIDEDVLQSILKQVSIKDTKGNEIYDKVYDIASRELELDGAIAAKERLRAENAPSEKLATAEREIEQYMARRAETEKLREDIYSQEFAFDGKRLKGEEVVKIIVERSKELGEWIYDNKIRIQDDFPQMLLDKAFVDIKTVRVNNETYILTDFKLDRAIENIIKPLTREGYIPRPGERQFTHDETTWFTYEQKLRRHAEDSIDSTTKKPKAGNQYEIDYARSVKDVRTFKTMREHLVDSDGNRLPGFKFLTNQMRSKVEAEIYIDTFYRLIRENSDDINIKRYKEWQEKRKDPSFSPTKKQEALFQAYRSYFGLISAKKMDKPLYQEKLGLLSGYMSTKNHQVPYKLGERYSQYDMDTLLAERKIDPELYIKEKRRHDFSTRFRGTGKKLGYIPHMDFDPIKLGNDILVKMEDIKRSSMTNEQKTDALENLANRRQKLLHENTLMDKNLSEAVANSLLITDMSADVGVRQLELLGGDRKPGNVLSRRFNLDGYARDVGIWGRYTDALNTSTYNNLVGVLAEQTIRSFNKKNPMGKYTKDWEYFMRIYARDVIGAPSTISKEILDSETLNIKNTPWWFMSDQAWYGSKTARKMAHLWTGRGKPDESVRSLYEYKKSIGDIKEKSFNAWWKKQRDLFETPYDVDGTPVKENIEFFSRRLKQVSMAEGKYAMATLLARAKSMVGNIFGGGTNNWVYTGSRNMFKSRDIEVWRSINPNTDPKKGPVFKTMDDVYAWAKTQGVVEGIIAYEIGLVGRARPTSYEGFIKDLGKMWRSDSITKTSFMELAKKHNVSQQIVDKASWFMRESERILRLRTFLSAYLQTRDSYHPIDFKLNDEFLISQAKKAVKAAQFFYHAPYRSPFARTNVGKIFSRFKLWAWNSVKFRRELYQEAKYRGFDPGSKEFERLQRLAIADMFVFGLANLLPYTMFDYSLPAPYSQLQDISDWAFGSEIQRDRAFYGSLPHPIAPLHELMPSILRGPEAIFGTMFTGAWDKLASYTLMSYLPFGLLSRDIYRSFQNPAMLMEFTTGIPIHQLGRAKKQVAEGKKAPAYSPGFF